MISEARLLLTRSATITSRYVSSGVTRHPDRRSSHWRTRVVLVRLLGHRPRHRYHRRRSERDEGRAVRQPGPPWCGLDDRLSERARGEMRAVGEGAPHAGQAAPGDVLAPPCD